MQIFILKNRGLHYPCTHTISILTFINGHFFSIKEECLPTLIVNRFVNKQTTKKNFETSSNLTEKITSIFKKATIYKMPLPKILELTKAAASTKIKEKGVSKVRETYVYSN